MGKKQHLEGYLSKTLKSRKDLWYMKLQVIPLAHTRTPADFLVLSKDYRYLIECKECKDNIFNLARLTQLADLNQFNNKFKSNKSYILLMFWKGTLKKSSIYLIPISYFNNFIKKIEKKSINEKEFNKNFTQYKVSSYKNLLNINDIR